MHARDPWNGCRWVEGDPTGHYESWFTRGNHPERPLAFWIRYTIFSPKGRAADAVGELWAVWFDGEEREVAAVKEILPASRCRFSKSDLEVRIGDHGIDRDGLHGQARSADHHLEWALSYTSPEPPLFLLPKAMYAAPFPKAKALVGSPHARFEGSVTVDGVAHDVGGFVGSQNHNWGERHTDEYVWGQVAGFDDAPDAFLEVATARVRVGPVFTPWLTPIVLRLDGEEHRLHTIPQAVRARARYDYFRWSFRSASDAIEIGGSIAAAASDFIGLPYDNPPGGTKTCLNSKIARCDLTVRRGGRLRTLTSRSRAAFEILTDATDHGVRVIEAPGAGRP